MYKKVVVTAMGIFILVIGVISFMLLEDTNTAFAADLEVIGDRHGLSILPNTQLFSMQNIVPGDVETSMVTVSNQGDAEFSIFLGSEKENGDEGLYENLNITVENNAGSQSYYSGSLKGLSNVALGSVIPGGEERLNLRMYFPSYIGNELQGKSLSIKFLFTAQSEQNETRSGTVDSYSGNNYSPDTIIVGNENIPAGSAVLLDTKPVKDSAKLVQTVMPEMPEKIKNQNLEEIAGEVVPAAGALPKSGGIPALAVSLVGIIIILLGIRLKNK